MTIGRGKACSAAALHVSMAGTFIEFRAALVYAEVSLLIQSDIYY
jgi:hypothetical protein